MYFIIINSLLDSHAGRRALHRRASFVPLVHRVPSRIMGLIALVHSLTFRPWVSNDTAQGILIYLHYASPICLLVLFLTALAGYSIVTAPKREPSPETPDLTGPGGKPLPKKTKSSKHNARLDFSPARKRLFIGLSVGAVLTYVADAAGIIVHALWDRRDNWWCGEARAVGTPFSTWSSVCPCTLLIWMHLDLRRIILLRLRPVPDLLAR